MRIMRITRGSSKVVYLVDRCTVLVHIGFPELLPTVCNSRASIHSGNLDVYQMTV